MSLRCDAAVTSCSDFGKEKSRASNGGCTDLEACAPIERRLDNAGAQHNYHGLTRHTVDNTARRGACSFYRNEL